MSTTTLCWQCSKSYAMSEATCPHCAAVNGNHALERAQAQQAQLLGTPTPWRISSTSPTILKPDSGCDEIVGESMQLIGSMHTAEDAALAVRCVNTHAELVAALDGFVKQWNACGPNSDFGRYFQSVYTQARAAIARATGGTS